MINKKTKRRTFRTLNLYDEGGPKSKWSQMAGVDKGASVAGAAAGAINGVLSGVTGGTESKAGNIMQGIGGAVSAIPGIGGIAGAALSVVGGLTNAMFGSKMNDEFIAETESNINNQQNLQVDAQSNTDLLSEWGDFSNVANVKKSQVGKDGWFANKAGKKTKELNKQIDAANNRALTAFSDRSNNIDTQNDIAIAANFADLGGYLFGNGGDIHIKKKNRGKFTEYCGGKVTSSCIQRGLHSSNPTTRKRANFARNARGWSHAFGGELGTNGTDWTNGVNIFEVGGTHEENPNQGIPQGMDEQGIPNLVEEGEVKFNDYIFSNRIKADKSILDMVGLPKGYKGKPYSKLAEKASAESKERPNDPISKTGLQDAMIKLQVAQELQREEKGDRKFAKGGRLYEDGNILSLAKRNSIDRALLPSLGNPADDLGAIRKQASSYDIPAPNNTMGSNSLPTWMRYAPALGGILGATTAALTPVDKPDFSDADSIQAARRTVSYTPLTQKLAYKPFDRDFYTNKLNAQAGATRRALANASGGNRGALMAGLIGADYNAQNQMGDLFRQAEEYNQNQRERVQTFNRGTDQANSQMGMQASMANADSSLRAGQMAASLRQAERQRYRGDKAAKRDAIAANLSNFLESIGGIGQENYWRNSLDSLGDAGVLQAFLQGNGQVTRGRAKGGKIKRNNLKLSI